MSLITLDFETFYSRDFSLSKMTTEQYIRDTAFEVIGFAYKVDGGESVWVTGTNQDIASALAALELEKHYLICHNAAFDGAILAWRYNILPKYYIDTLSMARPVTQATVGGSLKKLAEFFHLGEKGTEVVNAMGLRRSDFPPEQLADYGEYCRNDTDITYLLYNVLKQFSTPHEMYVIDMTIRMFTDPVVQLDHTVLQGHLTKVQEGKELALAKCGLDKDDLMSNPKFAAALESLGVDPPRKTSLATEKETWAFSKTDPEFKALLEHDNPDVQAIMAARFSLRSTLEESRTVSFMNIAGRGSLPIMLNYYGAHTGRWSGADKMNLQNLPRGGELRASMCAPEGHMLVACDSAQIEARVVAWLAGQDDLVEGFARGEDIYSAFATLLYGYPVSKATKVERHVGKTCLTADTIVLTNRGFVSLCAVQSTDLLWDGASWVTHSGVQPMGDKEVLSHAGLSATADHEIWTAHGWREWNEVCTDQSLFQSALSLGNLPSQDMCGTSAPVADHGGGNQPANVLVATKGQSTETAFGKGGLPGAIAAQKSPLAPSAIGPIRTPWQTISTGLDYLTGSLQRLVAATTKTMLRTSTMGCEALLSTPNGAQTRRRSSGMCRASMDGITPSTRWIGPMSMGVTPRAISGLSRAAPTCPTNEGLPTWKQESANLKPTFDITNAGPNHRFTVLTTAGPIIVHNCILGLGFGMGKDKFKASLKSGSISVDVALEESERIVKLYRNTYPDIVALWKQADNAIKAMASGHEYWFGTGVMLKCDSDGVHLPNGMVVRYRNLYFNANEKTYQYDGRYGPIKLYGAKLVENVVQALARIIVSNQMATIDKKLRTFDTPAKRFKLVLTVHDEVVCVVPAQVADKFAAFMTKVMSKPPRWCTDLPVACEVAVAQNYMECK